MKEGEVINKGEPERKEERRENMRIIVPTLIFSKREKSTKKNV
jgi:hypothetical protein